MKGLTELEGAVLGSVWANAPSSAYRVRQVFARSPSPHWSGSAGAVYPLLDRLRRRGLLSVETHFTGKRAGRQYRVTQRGLTHLRRWATDITERAAGVPVDPVRVRIRFLGALSLVQRNALLTAARRRVTAHLRTVEHDCRAQRAADDTLGYLTARGALLALRARLIWLREVKRLVSRKLSQ